MVSSETSLNVLDLSLISLIVLSIPVDIYSKPTDNQAHCTKAIPYGVATRVRRNCSNPETFQKRSREYQEYLINQAYSPRKVQQQFNKVTSIPRENLLTPKIREKNVLFPLVTDFKRAAGIFTSESSDEQLFGTDMTAVLQRYLKHEYRAKALQ